MLGREKDKQPKRAGSRKTDALRINVGEFQIDKVHKYLGTVFGMLADFISRKQ